jgi:voltage-gated potassium channel
LAEDFIVAGPIVRKLETTLKRLVLLLRVILREFRDFFIWTFTVFSASCGLLYYFYPKSELPHHQLSWLEASYFTWSMIFFNNQLPFVDHWLLSPLFFVLPIIGLVVVAEGVVRLGNLLLQHKRYSREWQSMIASVSENHIVVCGLGNVGIRVVEHLIMLGESVVAIEKSDKARFLKEAEAQGAAVLRGDARDISVLENAHIAKAKAIIAVTDDDLANLEIALHAREANSQIRLIVRMFDQKLAKMVEKSLGIDGAYSSSARSSRLFAQAAISKNILDSFQFGGTIINAYELSVDANTILVGATVDDVRRKYEVTVLLHERTDNQLDWNPSPSNSLSVGDKLLIMTDREGIERLQHASKALTLPKLHHD